MKIFQFVICIGLLIFLLGASNIEKVNLHLKDDEIAFTFFELRNGEAALIQNKSHNILINTGSDEAEYQLREQLAMYGIKDIDKLIITNNANIYTGNVADVLKDYHVDTLISSEAIMKSLKKRHDLSENKMKIWDDGKQKNVLPGLKTQVLYESAPESAVGKFHKQKSEVGLVLHFTFGSQKILYMGLAGPKVEKKVMDSQLVDSQILKIGEFGTNEGTMPSFLKKVDPQVAILFHKKGMLPSDQMIERLEEIWIDIYQTDRNGSITIKFKPHSYKIFTLPLNEDTVVSPG